VRTLFISGVLVAALCCLAPAQERGSGITFTFDGVPLHAACDTLVRRFGIPLVYLDTELEGRTVSARCNGCTEEEALSHLLSGTGLTWKRTLSQYMLVKLPVEREPALGTLAGTVSDSVTGEDLPGAYLLLYPDSSGLAAATLVRVSEANPFGFFSIRRLTPGIYHLLARAVGYKPMQQSCVISDSNSPLLNIRLPQDQIAMQEVVIEGRQVSFSAADGLTRGVFIPAVPSDQHQYLLDGSAVYNPAHFGGVLTTFSPDALRDVEVKPGGVPPYYGGRIGGILDLSVREGTMERFSGSVGTGSLGSHATLEGPIAGAGTFMISGRRGYPDLLPVSQEGDDRTSTQNFSELIAKLGHRLSESDRLTLTGYIGTDAYSNNVSGPRMHLDNHLSWGNACANLQWTGIASPSLFLQASAGFTSYNFDIEHLLTDSLFPLQSPGFGSNFRISDADLRANAEHFYDEEHTVRGGVELVHHRIDADIDQFSTQTGPFELHSYSAWELSLYLQDQWRLLPLVTAAFGARATSFLGDGGSFSGIEPRFSLLASPSEDVLITFSLTSIHQYMHPYRNSGIFLFYPTLFWYPSTDRIRPTSSLHISLGLEKSFLSGDFTISGELFHRVTHDLHEFRFNEGVSPVNDLSDVVLFGSGRVTGAKLGLRKRAGTLSASITYIFSSATNTFDELNNGDGYTPRFNRRHELQLDAWVALGERWMLGALAVLSSDQSPSFSPKFYLLDMILNRQEVIDMNGSRLPGFQRVEFRLSHLFSLSGFPCQASLRLMNDYGLIDPYTWTLRINPDPRLKWDATLGDLKLFPLNPAVSVSMKF
jgi:TonB-dependent receptor-like protein/carboxypeptidase-like protein